MTDSEIPPTEPIAKAPAFAYGRWIKRALFLVVFYFVVRRAGALWQPNTLDTITIQYGWLLAAACAYVAGWLPSVWFWQRLLSAVGNHVDFPSTATAYYCGHLGKYVPGKATVLIIRAALVKSHGARTSVAALTATYETLAVMGVGAAVAVALAGWAFPESIWQVLPAKLALIRENPLIAAVFVVVVGLAILPPMAKLFTGIAVKLTPPEFRTDGDGRTLRIETKLLALGAVAMAAGWFCHGLSLGLTIRAVASGPFDLAQWPAWTAATALATVVGFAAVFAPGGLGVREGLLIEFLRTQPGLSEPQAVVVSVLLRIVWFAAEIGMAGLLYFGTSSRRPSKQNLPE